VSRKWRSMLNDVCASSCTDVVFGVLNGRRLGERSELSGTQRLRRVPMGRVGTPEDVAYACWTSPPTNPRT
jgi:hypothetical protein